MRKWVLSNASLKTIQVRGQILNNVLFIELIPKRLYEVTFPEEIEENTLSPPKEMQSGL